MVTADRRQWRRHLRMTNAPLLATEGEAYTFEPTFKGGVAPYAVTLDSGELPDGLALEDGVISGTPIAAGTFKVWLKAVAANTRENFFPVTISVEAA